MNPLQSMWQFNRGRGIQQSYKRIFFPDTCPSLCDIMNENPMELFRREAPAVADAFDGLIQAIVAQEGLDQKTRQLIYIAMKASAGDAMAVRAHIPMAVAAGATKEEVSGAIVMTLTVSGVRGVVTCLPEAARYFEQKDH